MVYPPSRHARTAIISRITSLLVLSLSILLTACNIGIGGGSGTSSSDSWNTTIGSGAQGLQVYVEPDAGDGFLLDGINNAQKSVYLEMYLLTDRKIVSALEDAAHRLDVHVMLETHPYGSGSASVTTTLNKLQAAGANAKATSPNFSLTHEKGMVVDGNTSYIMTSNFTLSALGGSSSTTNREYDIIDKNPQDVQGMTDIFNADWNRTTAQFNDSNLVVSPVNSRSDFTSLINSAHHTLLIEAEEMQDSNIEQAITGAAQRGVHVQVILPAPSGSSTDSNSSGIDTIKQAGVQVRLQRGQRDIQDRA